MVVFARVEVDFLLSICNACAAFCALAGASWALIEGFREVPGAVRDGPGVPGEASGAPGEANLEEERGDWDI